MTSVTHRRSVALACVLLAGCSDSYYAVADVLRLDLIHKGEAAYLNVAVKEAYYRQSPAQAARSVAGGWPIAPPDFGRMESVVFEITPSATARHELPGNVSLFPVGGRVYADSQPDAPAGTEPQPEVYAVGGPRPLPAHERDALLARRLLPLDRQHAAEGWSHFPTSALRSKAERGEAVRLDLGPGEAKVALMLRPSSGVTTLVVEITPPDGEPVIEEFVYHEAARSLTKAERDAARAR